MLWTYSESLDGPEGRWEFPISKGDKIWNRQVFNENIAKKLHSMNFWNLHSQNGVPNLLR